jgi:hypothetical protein
MLWRQFCFFKNQLELGIMNRRVLVAVDLDSPTEFSISYGIRLAARTKSSVSVIAVSSSRLETNSPTAPQAISECSHHQLAWLNEAIDESRKRDTNIEMFVTSGDFFEQILQFVLSQPIIQFIVLDESNSAGGDAYKFSQGLRRLRKEFEGEILLVRRAGDVTHFSDPYGSARGIRV